MEPVEITDKQYEELRKVTALEAWCFALAIATVISQGNQEIAATIEAIAGDLHDKIAGGKNDEG